MLHFLSYFLSKTRIAMALSYFGSPEKLPYENITDYEISLSLALNCKIKTVLSVLVTIPDTELTGPRRVGMRSCPEAACPTNERCCAGERREQTW